MKALVRLGFLIAVMATTLLLAGSSAGAGSDPLPSWNEAPTKHAIVEFIRATTDPSNTKFVPPDERIAVFDQDGTLWASHPIYPQLMYCLDRLPAVVKARPALAKIEPFKTALSRNMEAISKLSTKDLIKIMAAPLSGMSVERFRADAEQWLETARHPRWGRRYTELTYLPMLELMKHLRANGYKTYIVTGGGQDFVRVYAEQTYGVPPEQVVGTLESVSYRYDKRGRPVLTRERRNTAQRRRLRQARGHPFDDRSSSARRVREFNGRPADARIHDVRGRRAVWHVGFARRPQARIRLWFGARLA